MTANDDQLAALGRSVLDQLIAAYDPDDDPELALAVLPGQAVSDPRSLSGEANALRVSEWLHAAYDDLLDLRLADCTLLPGAVGSGVPGTSLYGLVARFGRAAGDPGSPATQRVAAMLEDARRDLGPDPEILPLGSEPADWAEDASTAWRVFDTTISASTTTTTSTPAPPGGAAGASEAAEPAEVRVVNEDLWRLRTLPPEALVAPVLHADVELLRRERVNVLAETLAQAQVEPVVQEVVSPEAAAIDATTLAVAERDDAAVAERVGAITDLRSAVDVRALDVSAIDVSGFQMPFQARDLGVRAIGPDVELRALRPELATMETPLLHLGIETMDQAPAIETATTTTSDLHVHFEHCLVTITRRSSGRPWWHQELLADQGWYLPGMRRGDLVPEPDAPGTAHCLPRALLLLRGLSISGDWTADARMALAGAVPAVGPFLLEPAPAGGTVEVTAAATQVTTVRGVGTQVIGVLATPLPVLPPMDDPALGSTPTT